MKKWVSLHQHTDESNAGGYFEIVTKYTDYINYAKENKLPAVAITNHGNVARWIKHKLGVEEAGLKYIHGIEAYVTMDLNVKERGYHTILLAKNYEGVKQINRMSSKSFDRNDGHYYYKPRILFDDLVENVEKGNIFVTTACLAGGLSQTYDKSTLNEDDVSKILSYSDDDLTNRDEEFPYSLWFKKWVEFAVNNRDRVYLEVQPHIYKPQALYNKLLLTLAKEYGLKIIAANDIHALNPRHDELRKLIKKGKGGSYETDDDFELWCKTYDEMLEGFDKQGVLSSEEATSALDATIEIVNQIEEFELDKSHKYPKLYEDEEAEFQKDIKQGFVKRGLNKLPVKERNKYVKRVNYEYSVYKKNGAISYMLADKAMIDAAKADGRHVGYGRGSVSGSLIAYLTGSTEIDSVRHGLSFERFMNPERVSLADIDHDWLGEDKLWVQEWLLNNPQLHAASIMTANTYGLKGGIKALARGMGGYTPLEVQDICNQIEDDVIPDELYQSHKDLIDGAQEILGVIDSFGRHAAGIVLNTDTLDDTMGTQTISGWDYPVSQIAMKEIDYCNWTKFDVLGLDNMGLITRTCELAGLPFLTPDSTDIIDFNDENVWKSMRDFNVGIFQFEGDRAGKLLKDLFSDETLARIRTDVRDVNYIDLLSLCNAAQRPSGASYVEAVTEGKRKDNGHKALNDFLAPTLGYLVYQEQIMEFLVKFCGYSAGMADLIRRGIGEFFAC